MFKKNNLSLFLLRSQDNDPLFSQSPWRSKLTGTDGETLGGFPVKFLVQVVRIVTTNVTYVLEFPQNFYILFSPARHACPKSSWLKKNT